ncbi:MAG: TIGR03915 family putative DNA repair protein [Chitinophagaceae bacterium]
MNTMVYDGSFEGLLTAIFEAYEYKMVDVKIYSEGEAMPALFGNTHLVRTDQAKADRVYNKLKEKLTAIALSRVLKTHLSGLPAIENHLLAYVRYIIASKIPVENNYSHPDVLMVHQTSRKVDREKHRMEAFVRFQLTKDGLYYSIIQPDFNVLPLISKHFTDRYADQRWLIYDVRRKYGLYYNLKNVSEVEMHFDIDTTDSSRLATIHDENEELYQQLWQQYFSSVNIPARKNMKLHIQHMPKRYWRWLVEKRPHQRLTDDSQ